MSKTYTTVQGDQWDYIAYKIYGDETGVNTLLEANYQYKDITVFPAGITLVVPEYTRPLSSILPPWKS
jgi:phage tail protein X